ncbi:MAG: aminotransferase class III-fold pyridoxal phosphate-dependent enzyme [Candidatus Margulisiibacteriota bacterium]
MTKNNLVHRSQHCLSRVLGHATELEIEKGQGSYLIDYDGNKYLDFGAGIAVNATGHCHPDVVAAIQHQSTQLLHGCAGVIYYDQNITLAEQIGAITGDDLSSVFFTQSGTEAVEAALKCATYVRNKKQIIAFKGSFHGRTLGSLSVTTSNEKYLERYPLAFSDRIILDYPYYLNNPAPLNTENGYLNYLDAELQKIDHTKVAAIIIEPVLGEGGYVPASPSVLQRLRDWCNDTGVLLIFDEIQSGIGRTGHWFCYQHHGVSPDILTTAKGIASGLPLGACISTQDIMNQWTTGSHGGTYGGNPLACVAGSATLQVLEPRLSTIQALGNLAMTVLKDALSDHKNVAEIRGIGLMIGIEFVTDNGLPAPDIVSTIRERCLAANLLLVSCGTHGNVIRLMPPLTISDAELNAGLGIFISQCQQL